MAINSDVYIELKNKALEKFFARLNPMQKAAVFKTEGPLLILAGAGSGKTTVLVNRLVNMIMFGKAYHSSFVPQNVVEEDLNYLKDYISEKTDDNSLLKDIVAVDPIKAYRILAITFTNKAASELKDRIARVLNDDYAQMVTASTFHSACARILRQEIEILGYTKRFTIYDMDDSLRLIKEIVKLHNLDDKVYPARTIAGIISRCKDKLITPKEFVLEADKDTANPRMKKIAEIYKDYQTALKSADALDFDDIIGLTVELFKNNPDVLERYQNRYKYIMVDEYQDTNHAQYMFVSLLAGKYKNLCVVGDDDQSIYKFRGANIENILSFENQFSNAMVIRLEENYRSTKTILDAANQVINNNTERKGKTLWTSSDDGELIKIYNAQDELTEGKFVADEILKLVAEGGKFADNAILYRTNAQANSVERALVRAGIPYKVLSGVKFYERKEIKDVLAYLSVINNHNDYIRLGRIINEPKRAIGDATVETCRQIAATLGVGLFDVIAKADEYAPLSKKSSVLMGFAGMITDLSDRYDEGELTLTELFDEMLDKTTYSQFLQTLGPEGQMRLENVMELKSTIANYANENPEGDLAGFLEEIALYTDLDAYEEDADVTVLMTIHTAKGLEYKNVFVAGMEEGIFPGMQAMYDPAEIEEERRLCYVGITRAKEKLYLLHTTKRLLYGQTMRNRPSRFLGEIPKSLYEVETEISAIKTVKGSSYSAAVAGASKGSALGVGKKAVSAVVYAGGQQVKHKVFGEGEILKVVPMGNDQLLEVNFKTVGLKKIMSNYAKLEIL